MWVGAKMGSQLGVDSALGFTDCLRGTFDPRYGRCVCEYGWAGANCSTFVLSSCFTNNGDASASDDSLESARADAVCTVQRPLSCSCVQACVEYGAFTPHMVRYCFVRKVGAPLPVWLAETLGPLARLQPSDVPVPEEIKRGDVTFYEWRTHTRDRPATLRMEVTSDWELSLRFRDNKCCRAAPLAACRHLNYCSRQGTCVVRASDGLGSHCVCDTEHQGATCNVYATMQVNSKGAFAFSFRWALSPTAARYPRCLPRMCLARATRASSLLYKQYYNKCA